MLKKTALFLIIILSCFTFYGCTQTKNNKMTVTVTILPQKAFVEAVVKDLADVEVIVPSGASPESYESTPKQQLNIANSTIYFKIGVPVEENSLIKSISKVKVVDCSKKIRETYADEEFSEGERDPHIWLSIKRVKIMVQQIADEMSLIDSGNSEKYQANALEYINQLDLLNTEIESYFAGKKNKLFMTFHPAYAYLAAEYGLTMFALNEEGKETTAEKKILFIDKAKKDNIKFIFSQAEFDSNQDSWVKDIGAKITKLNPLSSDYINNYKTMAKNIADSMI